MERLIRYLRGRAEVSALYVFGSWRHGSAGGCRPSVGVLVEEGLLEGGSFRCSRKGCLAPEGEVVILNHAAPPLKYQAVRRGSVVFERDMAHRVRFTEQAVTEFFDHHRPAGDVSLGGLEEAVQEDLGAEMEPEGSGRADEEDGA